jgi:hypothetical protein
MSTCLRTLSLEDENSRLLDYQTADKAQKANNPELEGTTQFTALCVTDSRSEEASRVVVI